ncbi:DUF6058 family natural product biosynthesis protein [Pseudoduganella sp. GCM10020061]|uniref:DUF6058 family natural product biosynthesis protein n=1 Tax=Pseudoduganella sp. GCM10020061 TaxID=3317345 RepID=UPI003638DFBA
MTELDHYLATHYLDVAQSAAAANLTADEFEALVDRHLVPAPSYVVTSDGTLVSHVFGALPAPGSREDRYFHPSQSIWIARARHAIATCGEDGAEARLKEQFSTAFACALAALNLSTWRLRDSFDDSGLPIAAGLNARTDSAWSHFLHGTFGLCVASPVSEAHIAYKEVLQEKLACLSDHGARIAFPAGQGACMLELIDAYAAASMPFSPIEYARSSRKRLVDDLRTKLSAELAPA